LDEFQNSFSIENPSEINKALLDLRDIKEKAYQTYLAGKHWQIEDGSQLLEKEQAILQYQTKLINYANSTQYLMPALVALRWVSPKNYYERVPEFLVSQCNKWKDEQPDHPWVKQLCKESDPSNLPVLVGNIFPNLKLPMLTKDTISLKEQLGNKLTIIDLWASWCAPCRKENREVLVPIWDEYHEQGLQIVAYGLESDESIWRAAVERDGANRWFHASDLQGDDAPFLKKIRVRTIPANFILDDKGMVIAKNVHGTALMDLVKIHMKMK
jgi:thiol-disulfide isomerase/thioredoxin